MTYRPEIKRLGTYLIEAGLITPAQVDVALNDQEFMEDRMKFGEVLVARGWIKQQTLDYLIEKIVDPEQLIARKVVLEDSMVVRHSVHHDAHYDVHHDAHYDVHHERDTAELPTVIQSNHIHLANTIPEDITQPEPTEPILPIGGGRLGDIVRDKVVLDKSALDDRVSEPAIRAVTKPPIAQAQSLDGNQVFQIVTPSRHTATPIEDTVDPQLRNERKSLSSLPDEEDDMNWVG